MDLSFPNIIGLIGTAAILITYFLLQANYMKSTSFSYSIINAIGALFILYSLLYNWNLPTVIIEIFWFFISMYGFCKAIYSWKKK